LVVSDTRGRAEMKSIINQVIKYYERVGRERMLKKIFKFYPNIATAKLKKIIASGIFLDSN